MNLFASNEFVDAIIWHNSVVVWEHIFSELVSIVSNNVGSINRKQYTLLYEFIVYCGWLAIKSHIVTPSSVGLTLNLRTCHHTFS